MTGRAPLPLLLTLLIVAPLASAAHAATDTPAGPIDIGPMPPVAFASPVPGVPAVDTQGAQADVTLTVTELSSDFGPETYKTGSPANIRDADDVENQTTNWNAALGHHLNMTIDVTDGDQTLACDDRFIPEAYIATSAGRLYGFTPGTIDTSDPTNVCTSGLPGVRSFPLTFDLDGTPPTISGTEYPALLPGVYAVTLNLYHQVAPSPTNPGGVGPLAGTIQAPFSIANPNLAPDQETARFPEAALRLFSDVGATSTSAHEFTMLAQPLRSSGSTNVTIQFPGAPPGQPFGRIDHYALRIGGDLATPAQPPSLISDATPADELIDKVDDTEDRAAVAVARIDRTFNNASVVPSSATLIMEVRGADFATQSGPTVPQPYVPLHVITVHLEPSATQRVTGVASLVIPVSDNDYPYRGIDSSTAVPGVPETGSTTITLQDPTRASGGGTGSNAGDLYALRPLGQSHDIITKARLSREPNSPWVDATIPHISFADPVGAYTMLAMFYGSNDEFYGFSLADRGIGIQVTPLRLVEGESGDLLVTLTNLADDGDGVPGEEDFAIPITLRGSGFPDGEAYNTTLDRPLPEGGITTIRVPVAGSAPGTYNVVFTATSGELIATQDTTVEVISEERAREENRKWYDIPGPGAIVPLLLVAALVALARRRE